MYQTLYCFIKYLFYVICISFIYCVHGTVDTINLNQMTNLKKLL